MRKDVQQVKEFHNKFNLPVKDEPCLPSDRLDFRQDILEEEVKELREAMDANDIVGVLDAITDIQYVVVGTALEFGLGEVLEDAFDEVHRSNMSKLGENGKPIHRPDGKVLKGPNYFKPDLAQFIPTRLIAYWTGGVNEQND